MIHQDEGRRYGENSSTSSATSIDLTADEIAELVFEDFTTQDAPVDDVKMAHKCKAHKPLIREAELWFNISTHKSNQAFEKWTICNESAVECQQHLDYAKDILNSLEQAKRLAEHLLSESTKENIDPPVEKNNSRKIKKNPVKSKNLLRRSKRVTISSRRHESRNRKKSLRKIKYR